MKINLIVCDDMEKNKIYIKKFMNSKFVENKLLNINNNYYKYNNWCFIFEDLNYKYNFYNIQDLSLSDDTIDSNIERMYSILKDNILKSINIYYFYAIPYLYINKILERYKQFKFNIIYL